MPSKERPTCYLNFGDWYNDNLAPFFDKVTLLLTKGGEKNGADLLFVHWWAIFIKNSLALFELLSGAHYSYQINMTLRLLMEMAADATFINANRGNIPKQKGRFERISQKAQRLNGMTYRQMATEGKNFHLFIYNDNEKGSEVYTTDRVKLAYSDQDFSFYEYLCCFSHFNYLGMMYDLNISQPQKAPMAAKERISFIQIYPVIFEKMLYAIADLCDIDDLRNYDCSALKGILTGLCLGCYYNSAKVV